MTVEHLEPDTKRLKDSSGLLSDDSPLQLARRDWIPPRPTVLKGTAVECSLECLNEPAATCVVRCPSGQRGDGHASLRFCKGAPFAQKHR